MKHIVKNRYKSNLRVQPKIREYNSPCQKQFAADCDINSIVAKYHRGEDISRYRRHTASYGEEMPSENMYLQAEQKIRKVSEAFQQLPATDRDFFENDPVEFLKYMSDPDKKEDSYKRGYRSKPKDSNLSAGEPSGSKNEGSAAPQGGSADKNESKK